MNSTEYYNWLKKFEKRPVLHQALLATQNQKPSLPKYQYPDNVLMVNNLNRLCKSGIDFEVLADESVFIRSLDNQKLHKKQLFGGGLLISDNKAKELQAKTLQAQKSSYVWELSERERQIIMTLGAK